MRLLIQVGLVALGGALGSLLRWGVAILFARWFGTAFPWGTFFINVTGSLFLGWFYTTLTDRFADADGWLRADDLRLVIGVGMVGAYTTFSTFEYESHHLLRDGDNAKGLTYLIGSVALGLIAVRVGVILGRLR